MEETKGPVVVTLSCEATPSTETLEIGRAAWEAMTPGERLREVQDAAAETMNNSGGYGWHIDDPDDYAAVGDSVPDPLRELAEWLAAQGPVPPAEEMPDGVHTAAEWLLSQAIDRAREALGKGA